MKRTKLTFAAAALCTALYLAAPAQAQTTTTVQTLNSAGTVSEFSPDTITIRSGDATPVSYTASKTTTYVDETGAPVSMDVVKSGAPVTVYYTKSGDAMVADRVVVNRTSATTFSTAPADVVEKKTTTTTTTTGQ